MKTLKHSEVLCIQARRQIRAAYLIIGVMRYLQEIMAGEIPPGEDATAWAHGNSTSERALNVHLADTTAGLVCSMLVTAAPICEECRSKLGIDLRVTVISLARSALADPMEKFLATLERCL